MVALLTDDGVLRQGPDDARNARVQPERLFDAAFEVFQLGGVVRRARPVGALEYLVHLVE